METNDQPNERVMHGAMGTGCSMWVPIIPPNPGTLKVEPTARATQTELPGSVLVPDLTNLKTLKNI